MCQRQNCFCGPFTAAWCIFILLLSAACENLINCRQRLLFFFAAADILLHYSIKPVQCKELCLQNLFYLFIYLFNLNVYSLESVKGFFNIFSPLRIFVKCVLFVMHQIIDLINNDTLKTVQLLGCLLAMSKNTGQFSIPTDLVFPSIQRSLIVTCLTKVGSGGPRLPLP